MTQETTMIDVKRLSKMLNVSVKTVMVRISKGTIPSPDKRINGDHYWKPETITGMAQTK